MSARYQPSSRAAGALQAANKPAPARFDLGNGLLPSGASGVAKAFVAELDEQGKTVWSRGFVGLPEAYEDLGGVRAAFDAAQGITMVGNGNLQLDGQSTGEGAFQIGLDADARRGARSSGISSVKRRRRRHEVGGRSRREA